MLDQPLNLRDNTEIRVLMPLSPSCVLHCATGVPSYLLLCTAARFMVSASRCRYLVLSMLVLNVKSTDRRTTAACPDDSPLTTMS
uniref:Uncharacterized protein n=1 Tax=Manihot esculenta TaxID=3983 RepID=A0A251JG44_MANES